MLRERSDPEFSQFLETVWCEIIILVLRGFVILSLNSYLGAIFRSVRCESADEVTDVK